MPFCVLSVCTFKLGVSQSSYTKELSTTIFGFDAISIEPYRKETSKGSDTELVPLSLPVSGLSCLKESLYLKMGHLPIEVNVIGIESEIVRWQCTEIATSHQEAVPAAPRWLGN